VPKHLELNNLALRLKDKRHHVRMSRLPFELLMHFLQGAKLWLGMGIVNAHIKFEVGWAPGLALGHEVWAGKGGHGRAGWMQFKGGKWVVNGGAWMGEVGQGRSAAAVWCYRRRVQRAGVECGQAGLAATRSAAGCGDGPPALSARLPSRTCLNDLGVSQTAPPGVVLARR
jgi:hypothetical protein